MSNIVALRNILAGWQSTIAAAASVASSDMVPLPSLNRLNAGMQAALDALDSLKAAEEQATQVLSDPSRSAQNRVDTSDQLRVNAAQQAKAALDDLRAVQDDLHTRITAAWLGKKPAGADPVSVEGRKRDLQDVIETEAADAPHRIQVAARLLTDALAAGDDDSALTAWVLTSAMNLRYRAWGITDKMRDGAFASVVGSAAGQLAPLLASGAGTLANFIGAAQAGIDESIQGMKQLSDQWAVIFSGQGQYRPGANDGQPTSVDPSARYLGRR